MEWQEERVEIVSQPVNLGWKGNVAAAVCIAGVYYFYTDVKGEERRKKVKKYVKNNKKTVGIAAGAFALGGLIGYSLLKR